MRGFICNFFDSNTTVTRDFDYFFFQNMSYPVQVSVQVFKNGNLYLSFSYMGEPLAQNNENEFPSPFLEITFASEIQEIEKKNRCCAFCPDRKSFTSEIAMWEHVLQVHQGKGMVAEDLELQLLLLPYHRNISVSRHSSTKLGKRWPCAELKRSAIC